MLTFRNTDQISAPIAASRDGGKCLVDSLTCRCRRCPDDGLAVAAYDGVAEAAGAEEAVEAVLAYSMSDRPDCQNPCHRYPEQPQTAPEPTHSK